MDNIKTLVVDDNATSRLVLRHILTNGAGYDVRMADSGSVALEMMEVELPDVVLLDVNMPEMSGPEVLREIRARWGDSIKVVVVSASRGQREVREMLAMGVSGYILKPVEPQDVLSRVRELVETSPIYP